MGGAVSGIAKVVDKVVGSPDRSGGWTSANPREEKAISRASRSEEEMGARMRGARRRGRQLLADTRLNPEAGMQETLGGGTNLGQ